MVVKYYFRGNLKYSNERKGRQKAEEILVYMKIFELVILRYIYYLASFEIDKLAFWKIVLFVAMAATYLTHLSGPLSYKM